MNQGARRDAAAHRWTAAAPAQCAAGRGQRSWRGEPVGEGHARRDRGSTAGACR